MCGIVAYTGSKEAAAILLEGLQRLEYRGYDSAGLSLVNGTDIATYRSVGRVATLADIVNHKQVNGSAGIAHTRWATHGAPVTRNAHPHSDCKGRFFVVHNGIIENWRELKSELQKKGHKFTSDTDTEVLAHLIEQYSNSRNSLAEAVGQALRKIRGTYGLAVLSKTEPGTIIVARRSSPIVIGSNTDGFYVASDPLAIGRHINGITYLEDDEIAIITPASVSYRNLNSNKVKKDHEPYNLDLATITPGTYKHFMLKEIFEQPDSLRATLAGRVIASQGLAKLGGLESVAEKLRNIKHVHIVGCGTAYLAGYVGAMLIQEIGGVSASAHLASEFRYHTPLLSKDDVVIAVSQSGETADTLACVEDVKRRGVLALGVVNAVGSSIARATDAGVYTHCGPEVAVASTKAFTAQVATFGLIALMLGRQRDLSVTVAKRFAKELLSLPLQVEQTLKIAPLIKKIAREFKTSRNMFFIGRRYSYPTALEGALKLKEVSYIHAEGYGAGELKHGPIALIDKNLPTIGIVPNDSVRDKTLSNLEEIKARGGPIIALTTSGDNTLQKLTKQIVVLPAVSEPLSPIINTIPLQLLAYYMAVFNNRDVDKPRNLAKSVTVE